MYNTRAYSQPYAQTSMEPASVGDCPKPETTDARLVFVAVHTDLQSGGVGMARTLDQQGPGCSLKVKCTEIVEVVKCVRIGLCHVSSESSLVLRVSSLFLPWTLGIELMPSSLYSKHFCLQNSLSNSEWFFKKIIINLYQLYKLNGIHYDISMCYVNTSSLLLLTPSRYSTPPCPQKIPLKEDEYDQKLLASSKD